MEVSASEREREWTNFGRITARRNNRRTDSCRGGDRVRNLVSVQTRTAQQTRIIRCTHARTRQRPKATGTPDTFIIIIIIIVVVVVIYDIAKPIRPLAVTAAAAVVDFARSTSTSAFWRFDVYLTRIIYDNETAAATVRAPRGSLYGSRGYSAINNNNCDNCTRQCYNIGDNYNNIMAIDDEDDDEGVDYEHYNNILVPCLNH